MITNAATMPDAGCQMPDLGYRAGRQALRLLPVFFGLLFILLCSLPVPAATVTFRLIEQDADAVTNRTVTIKPLLGYVTVGGTNVLAPAPKTVSLTNGAATVTLLSCTYGISHSGLPGSYTIAVPDSASSYEAVDLMTNGLSTYTYTNFLGQISWRLRPGSGYSVVTNNAGQWNEYLTLTVDGAGGIATNATDVAAGSGVNVASNGFLRTLSAQFTNRYTLPLFVDGILFTNGASGQRSRLQYYEFLGAARLWLSNGVFEASYLEGNGSALTALNAANITSGNLDVARLNGGTGASATTYWRGDGTWATPAGGSGGVATLNGSATNLTMRGDTSIYGGADTVVQVTSDSPGELYGFGAWTVDQVASTNFVGNGANLSNVTARYVAASNITSGGSVPLAALHPSVLTNRTREVVTNLDSGFVLETTGGYLKGRIVPFTNPTRPGLQIHAADTLIVTVETNALSVAGAAPIYANGAGITNIPGASISGTLTNQVTCALFNVATNWADATNRFVLSPTNGNWQQLTLTNAAYIAVDASATNSGSTFRLTILGSNAVTWTTSNLSNAPAAALNASVTELLLDRSPYTNLWNLTKFR
jgi:hypothetical protein